MPLIDLGLVRRAIRDERKLELAYCDEQDRSSERVVRPIALVYHTEILHIIAWCELRQGFRRFRGDRIQRCVLLDDGFRGQGETLRTLWQAEATLPHHPGIRAAQLTRARHTQSVIQGWFVLAKAGNDPDLARESLDHLDRYIRHLFHVAEEDANMSETTEIGCACGRTRLRVAGSTRSSCPSACATAAGLLRIGSRRCPARRTSLHPTARRLARNIARIESGSCPARSI